VAERESLVTSGDIGYVLCRDVCGDRVQGSCRVRYMV
jgi:hypothetical protein